MYLSMPPKRNNGTDSLLLKLRAFGLAYPGLSGSTYEKSIARPGRGRAKWTELLIIGLFLWDPVVGGKRIAASFTYAHATISDRNRPGERMRLACEAADLSKGDQSAERIGSGARPDTWPPDK